MKTKEQIYKELSINMIGHETPVSQLTLLAMDKYADSRCRKFTDVLNMVKAYQQGILNDAKEFPTHPYAQYAVSIIDAILQEVEK